MEMFEVRILDEDDIDSDSESEADPDENTWEECKELGNDPFPEEKSSALTHVVG